MGGGDMTVMDENSLDTPPAPVPSRNTSHTSLCSLDLSVSRDQLYNRGLELRRAGSSTSIMNCDENSSSSFSFSDHCQAPAASGLSCEPGVSSSLTSDQCQEEVNNSEAASKMIFNVYRNHKLKCNPNLCEEGVRGKLSPHGLVMVLACGTLHNQNTVCGVFEQVFGLIRDPGAENNWKIKQTEARLVGGQVEVVPNVNTSKLEAVTFS